jgi:hypothetical protein
MHAEKLKTEFQQFRYTEEYQARREQTERFRPVAKAVLKSMLSKASVTNEDLTGLIHLFRPKPIGALAPKYLAHIAANTNEAQELTDRFRDLDLGGYTAPGRLKIHDLTTEQLATVRQFLTEADRITNAEDGALLCDTYDEKKVTYVTAGIYSPWLHYLNPEVFPILNNASKSFFKQHGLPTDYPALVRAMPKLQTAIGETDLGLLDSLAWQQGNTEQEDPKNGSWHNAKWIKKITRADWELFFDACNEVIERFEVGNDSPLLAMNIHANSTDGVRLSLSNREALSMQANEPSELLLMLPNGIGEQLLGTDISSIFPFRKPDNAEGVRVHANVFRNRWMDLSEHLFGSLEELLERSKSSPFRKHHIPDLYHMATDADFREKALDFLLEDKGVWPGAKSADQTNYWIFQANPKWYDAIGALRDNAVDRWSVAAHKKSIKPGDKAIIWVTGPSSGCYALVTITSAVTDLPIESPAYSRKEEFNSIHGRVLITIDHNLWDRPILESNITEAQLDLKAGNQGTTFAATKEQYEYLRTLATKPDHTMHDLNTILYGPPGTGKTFHSVTHTVAIIERRPVEQVMTECTDEQGRKQVRARFEQYMANGQVRSVTFHQSFTYEDFIEGIKPDVIGTDAEAQVTYAIKDGVFKQMCALASSAERLQRESGHANPVIAKEILDEAAFWKASIGYYTDPEDDAIYDYCMANEVFAMGWGEGVDMSNADSVEDMERKLRENNISTDGRVLTFLKYLRLQMKDGDIVLVSEGNETIRAIGIVNGPYFMDPSAPIRFKQFRKVRWIYKDISLPVRSVYGSAFAQGTLWQLKAHLIRRDRFQTATPSTTNNDRFVLIIDEINRGNISGIFGELITLIESDKRSGNTESANVRLPYSKEEDFSVPPNLHIIGTMNTADRSVEALDTALRRRFSFVEMPSKPELIKQPDKFSIHLQSLLAAINGRIERLLDKDHHIGHSYFMDIDRADDTEHALRLVFKNKVLPLLEEYFYGDPRKLGAVLGPQWVKKRQGPQHKLFGKFDIDDSAKDVFDVTDPMKAGLDDYASIYA